MNECKKFFLFDRSFVCFCICLSCLFMHFLFVHSFSCLLDHQFVCLCISLVVGFNVCLLDNLSLDYSFYFLSCYILYLCFCPFVRLSVCVLVYLFTRLSVYKSLCLRVYLFTSLYSFLLVCCLIRVLVHSVTCTFSTLSVNLLCM